MSNLAATVEAQTLTESAPDRFQWLDRRRLFLLSVALAAVIYLQFEPWNLAAGGDRANWDYFAQVISRGGVPYRDVVNIKTPFAAYLGAAAILCGELFGLRDIYAIRIAFAAMGILIVGFTLLVTLDYFNSRRAGVLAAIIMLAFNSFIVASSSGIQPKTPMMLFGLLSLWAIHKDNPWLAGAFGMLSALCWQPGLLFAGCAALAASRYFTSWRDLRLAKVVAGATIPLAALIAHLWAVGSLRDFYLWTIEFNAKVYAPRGVQPPSDVVGYIAKMLRGPYSTEVLYFYLAVGGFIFLAWNEMRQAKRDGPGYLVRRAPHHAVFIAPLVYSLFCSINVQGAADLYPLLPFVSIFAAVTIIRLLQWAAPMARRELEIRGNWLEAAVYVAICVAVFTANVADAFLYKPKFPRLADQQAAVAGMAAELQPGDKIFVHGSTELLVLSGLTNASKHFYLDRGKDLYLSRVEPGGFDGWLERLKAERPKVVALSRLRSVDRGRELRAWANSEYERREGQVFSYYVRRD